MSIQLSVRIPTVAPTVMVLGSERLGVGRLWPYAGPTRLYSLLPYVTRVTTYEGHRNDTPTLPVEPGSLSCTLRDAPDLAALGLKRHTPIVLYDENGVLWSGWIDRIRDEWDKETDTKTTEITAYDLATVLGGVTRYGATVAETVEDRLTNLAGSAPVPITAQVDDRMGDPAAADAPCIATARETSLLNHFQMTAAAAGGFLRIQSELNLENSTIQVRRPDQWWRIGTPPFLVNVKPWDLLQVTDQPGSLDSYYTVALSTPDETPTRLKLVSHGIDGSGNSATSEYEHVNDSAELFYRAKSTSVDTVAPPAALPALAAGFAPAPGYTQQVAEISTTARLRKTGGQLGTTPAPGGVRLRTLDTAAVTYRGQTYLSLITAIRHELTSDPYSDGSDIRDGIRHRTTYTLTPRS